jgi:hypothetical protein
MMEVKKIPQVPGIGFWRAYGGQTTSELGEETAVPHFRAMRDHHGRIIVVMTHNTDVSNSWERETEDPQYFYQFSIAGYALGVNVLLYAMTHDYFRARCLAVRRTSSGKSDSASDNSLNRSRSSASASRRRPSSR